MTVNDAEAVVQRQIDEGPVCACGCSRRGHADEYMFDAHCHLCGECRSYRPVGISYVDLIDREFPVERAAWYQSWWARWFR